MTETYTTGSNTETRKLGTRLARGLRAGDVIALFGELGSGKTCFTQGLGQGLNVKMPITSPTFTIMQEYPGRLPMFHFDFYRLNSDIELHDLGVDEYFDGDGISLIEWPEIVKEWLPENRIDIYLSATFDGKSQDIRNIKIYFDENLTKLNF